MQNYCLATTPRPWQAYVMHEEESQDMCPAAKGLLSKPWKKGRQRASCSGHVLAGLQGACACSGVWGAGVALPLPPSKLPQGPLPAAQHRLAPWALPPAEPGTPGWGTERRAAFLTCALRGAAVLLLFSTFFLCLGHGHLESRSSPEPLHNLIISSCWPGCLSPWSGHHHRDSSWCFLLNLNLNSMIQWLSSACCWFHGHSNIFLWSLPRVMSVSCSRNLRAFI